MHGSCVIAETPYLAQRLHTFFVHLQALDVEHITQPMQRVNVALVTEDEFSCASKQTKRFTDQHVPAISLQ